MLKGTVSMRNMAVVSLDTPTPGQCAMATLSPLEPIVDGGGYVYGNTVRVNTDLGLGFGSYWGTNQLLYFTGTLSGNTISGTVRGMTDGGTGGTSGTFLVTRT